MAKVRVYELAKELNMTNKALLNKMEEMNIEVKSHMSSLEDSTIKAIRQNLFGKGQKEFDDVKVRPSVIRRRKAKPETEGVEEASEESLVETEADEVPVDAPADAVPADVDAAAEEHVQAQADEPEADIPSVDPVEIPVEDTPPVVEEEDVEEEKSVKKSKKKFEAAKIIKPILDEEPVEEEVLEPESEDVEDMEAAAKIVEEPDAEPETVQPVEPIEEMAQPDQEPVSEPVEEQVAEPAQKEESEKRGKKKKAKKKAEPAKIVKVADTAILDNLKRAKAAEAAGKDNRAASEPKRETPKPDFRKAKPQEAASDKKFRINGLAEPIDIPIPADDDRAKRKKDKVSNDAEAEGHGRKKQRKKKAVVEKEDLYGGGRGRKKRGKKDAKAKKAKFQKTQITTPKAIKRRVKIDEAIELAELAKRMGIKANEMITKLMGMGVMATVNQTIDFETAALVAAEFDFEIEKASFEEENLLNMAPAAEDDADMVQCAPIVTIMGHVDHGKTSLLDVIRKSKITADEAGGITQHIGAYNVDTGNGLITFLDTPGHEAFTAMRSRGAKITDIVVLVVAADDGVMPQTIEAINHSKAADVPVVVAVNKMDKAGADPDRIMRELAEFDLLSEEWGGDVIFVKVSAKAQTGIDELLEMILLQSEVLELKANPDRKATGYVVESRLDTGRGAVATVLVKQGTLKDNEPIVCGLHHGKIRAMIDDTGKRIYEAGPSTPVEIVGLNGLPDAGDEFTAVASDKDAKQISDHRQQKQRAKELAKKSRANLEKMFENLGTDEAKELKLIVKADVQGSIEALSDSLKKMAKEEVDIKIIHSAAGTINESDVSLAAVSDAIIIGFNVRPTPQVRKLAKDENVDMRFYDIIYDVINDIQAAMDGMMPSTFHENIIGRAEVRDTFVVPKVGTIAGCFVLDGKVTRGKKVRLLRDGVIKCDTELSSLRRFKDDVKEVEQGYECGIGLEKYNDIKINDVIECYEVEERKYGE
ncbi:MAG: translation initiation factor IF-2 [Desulfobacteraceae bacterium]|nr:MAG: translation initiation factor IF-2 [Desulfobacteraceae bacterium]